MEPLLAIIEACLGLERQGINQGMAGNISVRHGTAMLITPSATPYDRMTPEDIARVDLATTEASGPKRPSSEWRFHRDILVARPEIGAVVHAHAPHATSLAIARRGIPPCHYMIASFGGEDVRCCGYATFGTQALSDLVIEALQDRTACLMANHGMIACGRDLEQAVWRTIELEALARQYVGSLAAGGPVLLSQAELAEAMQQFQDYRP